jgi:hypothetical protein
VILPLYIQKGIASLLAILIAMTMNVSYALSEELVLPQNSDVKWSGKTGQRAKMYPTLKTGYTNDEETQFFGQV